MKLFLVSASVAGEIQRFHSIRKMRGGDPCVQQEIPDEETAGSLAGTVLAVEDGVVETVWFIVLA